MKWYHFFKVYLHEASAHFLICPICLMWSSSSQWVTLWCTCGVLQVLCICPLASPIMSPCPPGCCCRLTGYLVLCESLGLQVLPCSVPLSTSALFVARNQLCNVDPLLQPFSGLQELSLSHNLQAHFPCSLPHSLELLLLQDNHLHQLWCRQAAGEPHSSGFGGQPHSGHPTWGTSDS